MEYMYKFTDWLFGNLEGLSAMFGIDVDFLSIGLFLLAIFLLVGLLMMFEAILRPKKIPSERELLGGVRGRIEKLERAVNEFKTEQGRVNHFLRTELAAVRENLKDVRVKANKVIQSGQYDMEPIIPLETIPVDPVAKAEEEIYAPMRDTQESIKIDWEEENIPEIAKVVTTEKKNLTEGLKSTRRGFLSKLKEVFSSKRILDSESLEELEAHLVSSDIGVNISAKLIELVSEEIKSGKEVNKDIFQDLVKQKIKAILSAGDIEGAIVPKNSESDGPFVMIFVGVNGVGKTTTLAKIANLWSSENKKVMLVAGDTFRAAASEQLEAWGDKLGIDVVRGNDGSKPAAVIYDAMEKAKKENYDIVLVDTAGRLQSKTPLMQELKGVKNVIQKHQSDAPHEVVLVIDGSVGQNAMSQAKEFNEATNLTGLIITKLDGASKGGIIVSIKDELGIPIRYIGIGEGEKDLIPFSSEEFTKALFDDSEIDFTQTVSAHGEKRKRKRRARH